MRSNIGSPEPFVAVGPVEPDLRISAVIAIPPPAVLTLPLRDSAAVILPG